jgi:hypothetical protein
VPGAPLTPNPSHPDAWVAKALARLEAGKSLPTDKYLLRPSLLMEAAGVPPDDWQRELLENPRPQTLLLCSRQSGKSTVTAALALQAALLEGPCLVLLVSRSQRQSGDLFQDKVLRLWTALGRPLAGDSPTQLTLTLANGSRILSLPGDEQTIRGYSGPRLLVIDEASRVPDALYYAVRPMLAVSKGRLVALSTPCGRRGWFHAEWSSEDADWHRVRITADQCPRIGADFLERERRRLGPRWFRQEYETSFEATEDEVFDYDAVMRIADDTVAPLWPESDDELSPYQLDDDEVPWQMDGNDPWPANVCKRCQRRTSPTALDGWGLCAECRTAPPREVYGPLAMGGERWVCSQCGRRFEKRPGADPVYCPYCSR